MDRANHNPPLIHRGGAKLALQANILCATTNFFTLCRDETMTRILVAWIGRTDLRAASGEIDGLGPIAQAVTARTFDRVELLHDYGPDKVAGFLDWLAPKSSAKIHAHHRPLERPTDYGAIYQAAHRLLTDLQAHPGLQLTLHLSPGTPAMGAVWLLLGKTAFPAELLESSWQEGVRTANVPFDIAADFIPSLLAEPDRRLAQLTASLPPAAPAFEAIVHQSEVMKRVVARARAVAMRSFPVLIEGESGTGKELFARAIHHCSPRKDGTFLAINCGAIQDNLVESELFGHEKGAFTGAVATRQGAFEAAKGGTLFLDEVGELPMHAQVKLLRVLQEKEIVRVGATQPTKIDVRIVAATNRTLIDEIREGRFREDLFYRFAVAVLKLPALRERAGDLGLLLDTLMAQVNDESEQEPGYNHKILSAGAKNLALNHPWPGNVRELLNTLRRAAVFTPGDTIQTEDLSDALLPTTASSPSFEDRQLGNGFDIQALLKDMTRTYLGRAMQEASGNKTKAADLLGLPSYQTLSNWLKKHGLQD